MDNNKTVYKNAKVCIKLPKVIYYDLSGFFEIVTSTTLLM